MKKVFSLPKRLAKRVIRLGSEINLAITKRYYHLPVVEIDVEANRESISKPILDDICLPPYHGPSDHDDYLPLMSIAKNLRPKTVVELGTAHGNIAANICRQCPEAKIYTVNALAEQQTGNMATYELNQDEIGRVYRAHGYESRVIQILQNTMDLDLSGHLDGPIVDLAIIDACHDTDYVVNDFLKVQPFIRPNGIVLLHDTHPSMNDHLEGSYVACMKLRRKKYDVHHIKNTWWAIWVNSRNGNPFENGLSIRPFKSELNAG